MPAPGQIISGSLSARIHRFLIDHHTDEGRTPKQIAAALPAPDGAEPAAWAQTVATQLARDARRGNLMKVRNGREVRYRRITPTLTDEERRGAARTRLRGVGVSITTENPFPPETWEVAAGVFVAAADRKD